MNVLCLGLSHRTAPVELRERFAIRDTAVEEMTRACAALEGVEEAVIVSTCNRVEYYLATADPLAVFPAVAQLLEKQCGLRPGPQFYRYDSPQSIRHLFRLVSGLDSMVLGETEVFGQVKRAYLAAAEAGGTARNLNKLFQRAFQVGKEVRSKTNITRGAVSVGSVAVDLAEKIFGKLGSCRVMILGAGETSEQTARRLQTRGVHSLFVSNRSQDRARALAEELGGRALRFEDWHGELEAVDILISSTSAPHFLLTPEKLEPAIRARGGRPLFVIDLAVPRDIDPRVNSLEGVYLYDIDSLDQLAREGMRDREQEVTFCEVIIERHLEEFGRWLGLHGGPSRSELAPTSPSDIPAARMVES